MTLRWTMTGLLFGALLVGFAHAGEAPDTVKASDVFAEGTALLQQGDFDGALAAFGKASEADEENAQYRQQFMLLRRIIAMRAALEKEQDPARWDSTAKALKNFYYTNRLYGDLLKLAREMHQKKQSVSSATLLADAMLNLQMNAEAVEVLSSLDQDGLTSHARLLMGIGLGREKKVDEARAILKSVDVSESSSPRFLFDVARLKVLCGDVEGGLGTLTTALEKTAPKGLDGFKDFVKRTPDFCDLTPAAELAKVLKTCSKVDESSCSSGSDCGSCPSKGSCGGQKP